MLYNLRRKLARNSFTKGIAGVLNTPPIEFASADFTIVSMVSHQDLLMYLLAIKSFYSKVGCGDIHIISDGTLSQRDQDVLKHHLRAPKFVDRDEIPIGRYLKHLMWQRLAYQVDLSADRYVIQLDSDTLTLGRTDEILDCIQKNRSFTQGTWDGLKIVTIREASTYAAASKSPGHIQILTERALQNLSNASTANYVRGSSGLGGLARGAFTRDRAEDFSIQMTNLIGDRFKEWGTDQVGFNFIVANSADPVVLPYPDYAVFGPELDIRRARFLHFIGTYRFSGGTYRRLGREAITALRK